MQQNTVITRAISILTAMTHKGAKFYVELPDGTTYGNIKMKQDKCKRQMRPYGSVKGAIIPYLIGMEVGDVAVIPVPSDFEKSEFQSAVATRAVQMWGRDAHHGLLNKAGTAVEVIRKK